MEKFYNKQAALAHPARAAPAAVTKAAVGSVGPRKPGASLWPSLALLPLAPLAPLSWALALLAFVLVFSLRQFSFSPCWFPWLRLSSLASPGGTGPGAGCTGPAGACGSGPGCAGPGCGGPGYTKGGWPEYRGAPKLDPERTALEMPSTTWKRCSN